MEKKRLNSRRTISIILLVLIVVCVLHFISPAEYHLVGNKQVDDNLTKLNKTISALDNAKIDAAISKAAFNVKIKQSGGDEGQLDNRLVFSKSALIGDSMAEGIVDYRILDSSNVFAERGKRLETADDLFASAISARPENLFIEFGMNDLIAYRGKEKPFIKEYLSKINQLKKELPNTNIYVVSISKISPLGIQEKPALKNFTGYNKAMKEMCRKEKINFVDTTLLFDSSSEYEFDGIHPKEPFYSNWVKLMCSYILESSEV